MTQELLKEIQSRYGDRKPYDALFCMFVRMQHLGTSSGLVLGKPDNLITLKGLKQLSGVSAGELADSLLFYNTHVPDYRRTIAEGFSRVILESLSRII